MDMELLVPDPGLVRKKYFENQSPGIEQSFPFWTKLWPSALGLAAYLENHRHIIFGKHVLELGAGLALPSFVAARYAGAVIASDYIEEAVDLMHLNIDLLHEKNLRAKMLDWNRLSEFDLAEVVLMSDLNYMPETFDPLLLVIKKILFAGSIIILSTPKRLMAKSFVQELMPYIAEREDMEIADTEILILILIRKTGKII
jgi:methyltransferase-like protein 23